MAKEAKLRAQARLRFTKGAWFFLLVTACMWLSAVGSRLNLLYLSASVLTTIFLVGVLVPPRNLTGVRAHRRLPPTVYACEPFRVWLKLLSSRRRTARSLDVSDALDGGRVVARYVPRLTRGEPADVCYEISISERGLHAISGPTVDCSYPFGLGKAETRLPSRSELIVYPRRGRLLRDVTSAGPIRPQRLGAVPYRGFGLDEFRSLREYQPGDNPRHIHWKISAKQRELYVREMEPEQTRASLILLDSALPLNASPFRKEQLELAISFAAAVGRRILEGGGELSLITRAPEPVFLSHLSGETGLHHLLRTLALLEPPPDEEIGELLGQAPRALFLDVDRAIGIFLSETQRSQALSVGELPIALSCYVVSVPEFREVFTWNNGGGRNS